MKTILRVISSAIMLAVAGIFVLVGKSAPELFNKWYPAFSQWLLGIVGKISGLLPLPLWQLAAVLLTGWFVYTLVRALSKGRILRWLSGVLWGGSLLLCVFVVFWGAGHLLPTKTEQIFELRPVTLQQLQEATSYYAEKLDEFAPRVAREEDGGVQMEDFALLTQKAAQSYTTVSSQYPVIPRAELTAKKLYVGDLFGYLGITGVFVPVTAEATVSPHTYPASLPFTICHEMGHRLGACAEEDANFLAFLACVASEDVQFQYSAWYSAFIYCYNALYAASPTEAEAVYRSLTPLAQQDVARANVHYEPYEGTAQELFNKVNDTYLKAAGQEAGVDSYGLVSDALIAWYEANVKNNA